MGGLYFSPSDNTDPNGNARTYSVERRAVAEPSRATDELTTLFDGPDRDRIAAYEELLTRSASSSSPFSSLPTKFLIAFTGRVGSTLLCEHLLHYGVYVAEFLHVPHIAGGRYISGADNFQDYCARLVTRFGSSGAFGVKATIPSVIPLFFVGEFPANVAMWRYVYITRENIIRQAISALIARETQAWTSWRVPVREVTEAEFSRAEIDTMIARIRHSQELWEKFFMMFKIRPLRLSYEEIAADPAECAARVGAHCGLTLGAGQVVAQFRKPPLKRQSGNINLVWEKRYRDGL